MKIFDTIAAVSTPRGKGGVALIRISGAEAILCAENVFFPKNGKKLCQVESSRATYGFIKEKDVKGGLLTLDDGIATVFRAPHSFTGEDTVEICCHGGALITERVLASCLAAGCRQAEAGEFTRRAFVSGRMSLSQAEDLGALLEAKNDAQLRLSRGGLEGYLTKEIKKAYEGLREIISSVYAKIDFPDEDLSELSENEMRDSISAVKERLVGLEATYKAGHAVREGVKTVICGKTNAGKSSLYNRIIGRDAAIVTDIPGTTRDVLEQTAAFGNVTLLLCDTAGLRDTEDVIENIGIQRSRRAIEEAELTFAVFDITEELREDDLELLSSLSDKDNVIAVLNKCDRQGENEKTAAKISESVKCCVRLSAKTGEGIDDLARAVERLFICDGIDLSSDAIITNARQHASILRAIQYLGAAEDALSSGITVDLCGTDVECAMSALCEIDGREVTEDIVSDIFAHFCVGK